MKKRVLLTAPRFYTYPEDLYKALLDLGYDAELVVYPKRYIAMPIFPGSPYHFIRKLYSLIKSDFSDYGKYCKKRTEGRGFDYLLSINIPVSKEYVQELRTKNPELKTIMYLWDSINRFDVRNYISMYDRVFTFDYSDSKKYGFNYSINFWSVAHGIIVKDNIDYFFVGKFSFDRADYLTKLIKNNPNSSFFIKLLVTKKSLYKKWVKTRDAYDFELMKKFITYDAIPLYESTKYLMEAKCIIDIESYCQNGLSQRNILALAKGKKLLTTNKLLISNYEGNSQVRDARKEYADLSVWVNEKVNNPELANLMNQSEVHNWINNIFRE